MRLSNACRHCRLDVALHNTTRARKGAADLIDLQRVGEGHCSGAARARSGTAERSYCQQPLARRLMPRQVIERRQTMCAARVVMMAIMTLEAAIMCRTPALTCVSACLAKFWFNALCSEEI